MKILITGGLGKIGSHLSEILSKNYEVSILDNFSNITKNSSLNKKQQLNQQKLISKKQLSQQKLISLIKGDIRDSKIIDKLDNNDIIIHTAAQTSVNRSIEDPKFDSDSNINGTLNMLEISRKLDAKFIYISSAAVYGIPAYLPIDEKHPTNPISPYGLSKLTGEEYTMLYHSLYGLPATCVRLFNVFGFPNSNDSYSGVITKFMNSVKNNENPKIFGDGNQTRDFVYINDVVNAISKIIEDDKTIGEVYNIGSGKPTKILDLANMIINIFDKKVEPEFYPAKVGDIRDSFANINKIKDIVSPNYPLEKGLDEMIASFR